MFDLSFAVSSTCVCTCVSAHVCVSPQACACMCRGGVNIPEAEKELAKAGGKEPLGFGLGVKIEVLI